MNDKTLKILFADDDVTYSLFLKRFLEKEGYEVMHVPDGEQALTQFRLSRPDLVLLDINMPEVNGFEVARQIRLWDKKVMLFFLSDRTEISDRLKGFSLKGNDYIPKPFYPEELLAKIQERFSASEETDSSYQVSQTSFRPDLNELTVCARRHPEPSMGKRCLRQFVSPERTDNLLAPLLESRPRAKYRVYQEKRIYPESRTT